MKRHFQNWGALYILAGLFVGSLVGQFVAAMVVGHQDLASFLAAIFENWQSEWIQLFVQALLINALGHVLYRKEEEDQERMERKLDELLARLPSSFQARPFRSGEQADSGGALNEKKLGPGT